MRYHLAPIFCRPWLLNGLSQRLIESHYENNYGSALRRLNVISEKLASLDFAATPGYVITGLKREELTALNSTLLHELYFASLGGDGKPAEAMADALARDFGSFDRWRAEFVAMGNALGGGSGWVLLVNVPRDGRLINPRTGHVRARLSPRFRRQRGRVRRCLHAQHRLARRADRERRNRHGRNHQFRC
jgi:Fe-Mn family superoxide dismutase